MSKPLLIKPKKIGRHAGGSVFGGLFIGIEWEKCGNTNEILHRFFTDAGVLVDLTPEGKDYKGEPVKVWRLSSKHIRMLYEERHNFKLKFVVYAEINYTLQIFRLLEPAMRKKAKQVKSIKKFAKHI